MAGSSGKRVTAGILAILLGGIGVHKFFLGYTTAGIIHLLLCWTGIPGLIGLIEGIIYLTKTDEQFDATYVTGRKAWF
jgi:TM2 domain-containing membrane protein YozV